jgi:proline dehydrogenase
MEGSAYTERTIQIVLEMRRRFDCVGTVLQAALYRTMQDPARSQCDPCQGMQDIQARG